MRTLRTSRLVLEPVTVHNAAALWRVMQSAQLREFQDVPRLSRDDFVRRVDERPKRFDGMSTGRFEWLVVVRRSKAAIGWVSLRVPDHSQHVAELGYSLVAPARKRGYASEAARAIIEAAFLEGGMRRVDACCVPENAASRQVLARIGFAELRLSPNGAVVRGRPVDVCMFALTREEWEQRSAVSTG